MTAKRVFLTCVLALAALVAPAHTQTPAPYAARSVLLAYAYDLDGEAADADQVVTVVDLADSTSYTIAANPDVCRLVDITITDADSSISAGVLTVLGTDCWDYPIKATFTFAAGGSGVKTLTATAADATHPLKASAAYFKTVTEVSNALLTGESGIPGTDRITVGYTTNSAKGWVLHGRQAATPSGRRYVDIFSNYSVPVLVKNGAATTDITAVSASTTAPFQNVSVGDLIVLNVSGEMFERIVTTRTDADNIIINSGVTIPTAGVTFAYRKQFYSTDPIDGWISVVGYDVVTFVTDVEANVDTGGVVTSVECGTFLVSDPPTAQAAVEVDTATVASTATGTDVSSIDLRLNPQYTHCRSALKFGTGDDGDTAPENINVVVGFRR